MKKPGELDIRIDKDGIPVAIIEGPCHSSKEYLYKHIDKALNKYNISGCRAIYVIEYSRNKGFGGFWDGAIEALESYDGVEVAEENTGLLGVKLLRGTFDWHGQSGEFNYIGVNCYAR